jgi:hypothetical protein
MKQNETRFLSVFALQVVGDNTNKVRIVEGMLSSKLHTSL